MPPAKMHPFCSSFTGKRLPPQRAFSASVNRRPVVVQALFRSKAPDAPMTVAITGATGLVGSRLAAKLASEGVAVKVLTRNVAAARAKLPYRGLEFVGMYDWDVALKGCYGVVNLAGEPIATRWDDRIKREIKTSRVGTTQRLSAAINKLSGSDKPQVFVSSSAIGYYGSSDRGTFKEDSPSGRDYLAEICREWEAAAMQAKGTRTVIIRNGLVLAKEGGVLAKMIPVFQLFSGGPLGSGNQWMSWVHRDDLVALIIQALKSKEYSGVYNGTAPNPVRMSAVCSSLGRSLNRPSWLPVPDFAIKGLLGEGATVVLEGQKVLPSRAQQAGFKFKYLTIDDAVTSIMST